MSHIFFNNFSKLFLGKNTSNSLQSNNTLPSNNCNNGSPIDKYSGYSVYAWEVMYSIWCANQPIIGAQFSLNQGNVSAPVSHPTKGPANIFIIRHGEKNHGSYSLNNNGVYRACQLINFTNNLARNGNPISYIITCNPCPYNSFDKSMRPQQTMFMTSFMLNIPLFIFGGSQDFDSIVNELYGSGIFDGLNVLICWEHSAIQSLCLSILDGGASQLPTRLPEGINNGGEFFANIPNLCPNGNYRYPGTDITNPYYTNDTNSQYYPYWNNNNFDNVYWFKSEQSTGYVFDFNIFKQDIYTCEPSCDLLIGLYQPLQIPCEEKAYTYTTNNSTSLENNCQPPPSDWAV